MLAITIKLTRGMLETPVLGINRPSEIIGFTGRVTEFTSFMSDFSVTPLFTFLWKRTGYGD